jgi:hypothetical protein
MDDSIATPTEPTVQFAPPAAPEALMSVGRNDQGDLVIIVAKETRAADLILTLLNGLKLQ